MKRPQSQMPRRPRQVSSATARTPKEAAIRLVRLEFDASRLEMGISQAENRVAAYRDELRHNRQQRQLLLNILKT